MSRGVRAFLLLLASAADAAAQEPPASVAASTPAQGLDVVIDRIDLRELPLRDALRLLSEETGVNLAASEKAAEKSVSIYLRNASVRQAVETITKAYGLWYREDKSTGVLRVLSTDEFNRDLALFRDEETEVFTLLYPNSFDVAFAIRNLFGNRVHLSLDREYQFDEYTEIQQRFQKFNLLQQQAQSLGIFSGSTNQTYGGFGGGFGGYGGYGSGQYGGGLFNNGFGGGGFYGTNYQNNGVYGSGMQPPQQLGPRAPISPDEAQNYSGAESRPESATAQSAADRKTSIYVSVIRRSNTIAVRTSDPSAMREIQRIVRSLDVPTPQVLLEVKVLTLDLSDEFNSAFDFVYNAAGQTGSFTTGNIPGNGGLLKPNEFIYQYVNDHFAARIQLLQDKQRVAAVASPVLLVANNEVAQVFVGEQVPVVVNISSQTVVNQNVVTTTPNTTTELRPVGTTLLITPNVNADRTVTLRVLQENSDINHNGATIPVVTSDGTVTNQPVDTVRSRTVTGTVVAKDGLTLALGGLVEEGLGDAISGIPGLMDLPLVGVFFRRETKTRTRKELVVLIRPYVLFTANEGNEMSRELANQISIHPSTASMGAQPFNTFRKDEAPRPPLNQYPLRDILKLQSGLPDGR